MNVNKLPAEVAQTEQTTSKKRLLILVGGAILLLFILGVSFFMQQRSKVPVPVPPSRQPTLSVPTGFDTAYPALSLIPDEAVPTSPPTPVWTPERIIVSDIPVMDFYKTSVRVDANGDALLAENPDYQIRYAKEFQEFTIVVSGASFNEARDRAEAQFVNMLGVDEPNACRLSVEVHIPQNTPNEYAGLVFPLSFCHDDNENETH